MIWLLSFVQKATQIIVLLATSIALLALLFVGGHAIFSTSFHGTAITSNQISTTDFVTIVLASVTVILAALAIFLAIAGLIGYTEIKNYVLRTATAVATKTARDVALKRVGEIESGNVNKQLGIKT